MGKTKRPKRKTTPDGNRVHVYVLVPTFIHDWLETEAKSQGLKNVQEAIVSVLRNAHSEVKQQAA